MRGWKGLSGPRLTFFVRHTRRRKVRRKNTSFSRYCGWVVSALSGTGDVGGGVVVRVVEGGWRKGGGVSGRGGWDSVSKQGYNNVLQRPLQGWKHKVTTV